MTLIKYILKQQPPTTEGESKKEERQMGEEIS